MGVCSKIVFARDRKVGNLTNLRKLSTRHTSWFVKIGTVWESWKSVMTCWFAVFSVCRYEFDRVALCEFE